MTNSPTCTKGNLAHCAAAFLLLVGGLSGCGDDTAILTVYPEVTAPIDGSRVELRSQARFGDASGTVTLDGKPVTVTSWTPSVILFRLGPEDRTGRIDVRPADDRLLHGPTLALGQGNDTLATAWDRHVESYAQRYGFGSKWVSFMKGAYGHYAAAFERQTLERMTDRKTLTLAYHYWGEARPAFQHPWPGDTEWQQESSHMQGVDRYLSLMYPGWDFELTYLGRPEDHDGTLYGNWPGNGKADGYLSMGFDSDLGMTVSTIVVGKADKALGHEVGHRLGLNHHDWNHLPPGEILCLMNHNYAGLCSACMCALDVARENFSILKLWEEYFRLSWRY